MFLTNNRNSLKLYDWLKDRESLVNLYSGELNEAMIKSISPCFIVSYNYSHIISKEVIDCMREQIINLHISYLPWNRGSDPNFWSFIDDTPKGVTIHCIDDKLDAGKILIQKKIVFDEQRESFASSYDRLNIEIVHLFQENWMSIKAGTLKGYFCTEAGSYHAHKDFLRFINDYSFSWNENISQFKEKIDLESLRSKKL